MVLVAMGSLGSAYSPPMTRCHLRSLAVVLIGLLAVPTPLATQPATPDWIARSNAYANILLRVMARLAPESSAERGVEGLDEATSYFYGYTRLMQLRADVERVTGRSFDAQAFHDFVLSQGLLPPVLMHEAVMARFAGRK